MKEKHTYGIRQNQANEGHNF